MPERVQRLSLEFFSETLLQAHSRTGRRGTVLFDRGLGEMERLIGCLGVQSELVFLFLSLCGPYIISRGRGEGIHGIEWGCIHMYIL